MGQLVIGHYDHPADLSDVFGDQIGSDFQPENLTFVLNKGENAPHEINYEISRSRSLIGPDFVGPYRTDFKLSYIGSGIGTDTNCTIMAGPHTMLNVESRAEHAKVGGKDWLHRLEDVSWPFNDLDPLAHRLGIGGTTDFNPPPGFAYYVTSRQVTTIIKDIFDYVLAQDNAPYCPVGIAGAGLTTVSHAIQYEVDLIDTQNLLSRVQTLAQQDPGEFDFWVDPDSRELLNAVPRQYDIAVVSDDSYAIHTFDDTIETSGTFDVRFTNTGPTQTRLLGLGQSVNNDLASVNEYTPASEVYGLKMNTINFSDAKNRTRVQNLTRKSLLFGLNPVHEIELDVDPSQITAFTPGAFWATFKPGKAIWLTAHLEAHTIDSAQEIVTMTVKEDNQGNVMVTLGLNQIYAAATLDV